MNQSDNSEIVEQVYNEVKTKLANLINKIVMFSAALAALVGILGFLSFESIVDRAVESHIERKGNLISEQIIENNITLSQLNEDKRVVAERTTRELEAAIEKAKSAQSGFESRRSELENLIERVQKLSEGENLARTLSLLELDYFTLKSIEVVTGVCFVGGSEAPFYLIAPDLIYSNPIEVDMTLTRDSIEPLELEFHPVTEVITSLNHSSRSCVEYPSIPYAPYKRFIYGSKMDILPPIDGIKLNSSSFRDRASLDKFALSFEDVELLYFRIVVNGVIVYSSEIESKKIKWREPKDESNIETSKLIGFVELFSEIDVRKFFEGRIESN